LFYLLVTELPMAYFDGVEPRVVEDIIAVFQVYGLLDGSNVDARQATKGYGYVTIGGGIVCCPTGPAAPPIASISAAETGVWRIHQASELPLCFFLVVRRDGDVVLTGIFAPRHLPSDCAADGEEREAAAE